MSVSSQTEYASTSTVEGVLVLVRKQGGRVTSGRRLLLEAVFATVGYQTAEQLAATVQAKVPDVRQHID